MVHTSPGVLSERATIFAATGLSEAAAEQDPDEQIEVVRLPRAELDDGARRRSPTRPR